MASLWRTLVPVALLGLALCLAPEMLSNDYYISVLNLCCINAIVVAGLNLLMGYAGQISLGHAAFYGLGAYTTAVCTVTFGLPMELSLPIALVLVAVIAFLIGIPTLKLSGHYLAMATLGFGFIVHIFFSQATKLTGGPTGFANLGQGSIPRLKLLGMTFKSDTQFYYLLAVVLLLVVVVSLNLIQSRMGRALKAIHTSEKAAQVSGIDIAKYKLFVFVLSAVFAALAGYLYAHSRNSISPSSFGFGHSVALMTMVVLGGMANMWGAVAGAFFLTALPEFLRAFEDFEHIIYGAILIVCMMFLPGGLADGLGRLQRLVLKIFSRKEKGEEARA